MNNFYTLLALDSPRIAPPRPKRPAGPRSPAAGIPSRPGIVRRGLANGFALVTRGSAAAVRRLDACLADDLTEALAAAK